MRDPGKDTKDACDARPAPPTALLLAELAKRSLPAEAGVDPAAGAAEAEAGASLRLVSEADLRAVLGARGRPPRGRDAGDPPARRQLEAAAIREGLVPRRYLRNIGTLGLEGQARLLEAAVGVAGLGGLGGVLCELLARAGVGRLVAVDPDIITEDNLNRQIMAITTGVGRSKTGAVRERLAQVNPSVEVVTHRLRAGGSEFALLFGGVSVIVDALDTLPARFALEEAAAALDVPLVHGAIAGMYGQVAVIFPGEPGLRVIYGPPVGTPGSGPGAEAGNLSPTPAMVAALQAQEVIKLVSGIGRPLRRKLLIVDSLTSYAGVVDL